jgi:hypothetical protein
MPLSMPFFSLCSHSNFVNFFAIFRPIFTHFSPIFAHFSSYFIQSRSFFAHFGYFCLFLPILPIFAYFLPIFAYILPIFTYIFAYFSASQERLGRVWLSGAPAARAGPAELYGQGVPRRGAGGGGGDAQLRVHAEVRGGTNVGSGCV